MIYIYKCTECKHKQNIEIPMGIDLPKDAKCEKCTGLLKHDFASQIREQSIEIPQHFQATSRYAPRMKYRKDATIENLD